MQFAPDVERWRSLVAKYNPPELVDKVLWVINYESSGRPAVVNDSGFVGLLQIGPSELGGDFANRPSTAQLIDPEFAIRYAAQSLGTARGRFTDWGEGTHGRPPYSASNPSGQFGALGDHPFPGANAADIPVGLPGWLDPRNLPDVPGPWGWRNIPLFPGLPITPGNPTGGLTDNLGAIANAFGVIGTAFVWLLDARHWFRIFAVGVGITLTLAGLYIYVRGTAAIGDVKRGAAVASEA